MPLRRRGQQARRHAAHRVPLPGPGGHLPFERLVERTIDSLPPSVRRLLDDVAIVIEDEPDAEQRGTMRLEDHGTLYGLYEGVPGTLYGADWSPVPNKISLFRLPLEEDFPDPEDLALEVRRTVLHELAHHAGIEDDRLDALGMG